MPVQVASSFVASVEDKVIAVMQLSVEDEEMNAFRVLLDSGCSKTASPFQKDFVGTIVFYAEPLNFSGIGGDIKILGEGTVEYVFTADDGSLLPCRGKAFFVPQCPHRLICPQDFLHVEGHGLKFSTESGPGKSSTLCCEATGQTVTVGLDPGCNLPFALARRLCEINASLLALNGCILDVKNENLTGAQKDLLRRISSLATSI